MKVLEPKVQFFNWRILFLISTVFIFTSCGGGNNTPLKPPVIQSSNLFYGVKATFFVGVTALNDGIQFSASNCSNFASVNSPNPLYLAYSCTVTKTGDLIFLAKDTAGNEITSKTFSVPMPQVNMVTSLGSVVLELNPNLAPLSVNNFLQYVQDGFYTNTIFHRVIPNFVAQAGGFTTGMVTKAPTYAAINLESQNGLLNVKGSLAMARTSDPNSATSQFFVNLIDNAFLNYSSDASPGYTVFGRVLSGQDVIDKMATIPTATVNAYSDVPTSDITITSMLRTQ
jgi:peptidyl-prolyl cis-trans isomerase A (cyclophilin A)